MNGIVELRFVNSDALPKSAVIQCHRASIPLIMAWYGAFYAGDRYSVFVDGEKVDKDHNGQMVA